MECQNNDNKSTIGSFLSEMVGIILKTFQSGIIDRIEQAINRVVRDAVGVVIFALLGLVGFVFFLTGAAVWLGTFSGLGLGFGLMSVGGFIFVVALFIGLIKKAR